MKESPVMDNDELQAQVAELRQNLTWLSELSTTKTGNCVMFETL